jgi:diaminopimelate decarboxylase
MMANDDSTRYIAVRVYSRQVIFSEPGIAARSGWQSRANEASGRRPGCRPRSPRTVEPGGIEAGSAVASGGTPCYDTVHVCFPRYPDGRERAAWASARSEARHVRVVTRSTGAGGARGGSHDLGADLRVVDGRLWIEQCDAVALAKQFGTPLYVMSAARLRGNARGLRQEFERHWPFGPVEFLASLKANYVLAVRQLLNDEGLGCDVFGSNELFTALRAGVPANRISVNGSAKSDQLLRWAVSEGATVTLDSERELEALIAITTALEKRTRIRLRLRPDYPTLTEPSDFFPEMAIRDAAQLYKPGIEPTAARDVGRRALSAGNLELTGLMTHLGRHSADPAVWIKMAQGFGALVAELCEAWAPWRPRELDIGGGLPAARDPTDPERRPAAALGEYAGGIAGALGAALTAGGVKPDGISLLVEPGRSLFADAGLHLSRVVHVKTQSRPVPATWIEVDTTEMFMPDLLIEHAYFTPVFASRMTAPPVGPAHIVGISCGFDLIARDVLAPAVQAGDVIAFLDTGAYQDAAASNFDVLGRPGTVLVDGNRARLVKRHETVDDVLGRDEPDAAEVIV